MIDLEKKLNEEVESAAELILNSKYGVSLTGSGISVASGVSTFRGPNGLWTKYGEPDMSGYQKFLENPKSWWEKRLKSKSIFNGLINQIKESKPNNGHYALAELESMKLLKAVITQNIDNLHQAAGSKNVIEIHGNLYKLRCISCNSRFDRDEFSLDKLDILPPKCPHCQGIIKPDAVMFGESIPQDVLQRSREESKVCDCMLVVGTSAVIIPAADFPILAKRHGASLIEINPSETPLTPSCDIILRGPSEKVLPLLVKSIKRKVEGHI